MVQGRPQAIAHRKQGILYVVAYENGTNASYAGAKLASDPMARLMLDGALRAASNKHKTTH